MVNKFKIVFVGHVDHGKSTLIGRLFYDAKLIPDDKIQDMKAKNGESSIIDYAFLTDHFKEERYQGITIDTSQIFFKYKNKEYVFIDAPGHVEFITNMITGAAQSDIAVLIIDANEGIQEQTKRHAYILSLLGIKKIILVINKMDLVDYSEKHFKNAIDSVVPFLKQIDITDYSTVPVSALFGDNIITKSNNMLWYDGKTLIDIFENIEPNIYNKNNDVIFPVQDVYITKPDSYLYRTIVGRIELGKIRINQQIYILPSGESANIKSIKKYNKSIEKASAGECIGLIIDRPLFIERGNIISSKINGQIITNSFKATIFWFSSTPGKTKEKITLKCSTQETYCYINNIKKKINSSTLEFIHTKKEYINRLEVCEVEIITKIPLVLNTTLENNILSRIVLIKDSNIIAGGIITKIYKGE